MKNYDSIIENFNGSKFTAFYTNGEKVKLITNGMAINVYKPGCCPAYGKGEVFRDAIIEFSVDIASRFVYEDMKTIESTIEKAIDLLNKEDKNLIDRTSPATYDIIKREKFLYPFPDVYDVLENGLSLGGIYLDEDNKKWVFLGKGTVMSCGNQLNAFSNNGMSLCEFVYGEYGERGYFEIGTNEYLTFDSNHAIKTFSSPKKFIAKIGQLDIDENCSINIRESFENSYMVPNSWEIIPGKSPDVKKQIKIR